ncbi:hypothetical protein K474DRAFT_1710663 [Panus rudis PR-1116 ss-1]|nr:hypothetical protein K474DRAFT_1710663 [Panus rudis PR-1116 ss-1]
MALTATAQSALPPEPTWDEVIVPTLRKRLEDESHALAKRMSAASMTSQEESYTLYGLREHTSSPSSQISKPSSIPRPSLQHSRTDTSGGSGKTINGQYELSGSASVKRPRTFSQPQPFDPSSSTSSPPLPSQSYSQSYSQRPPSARSNSPMTNVKATRIPISRGRTNSTSSNQPSIHNANMARSESRNGLTSKLNGHASAELWPVDEGQYPPSSMNSKSTFRTPRSQMSELVNESAPFNSSSLSSRGGYDFDVTPSRLSSDSEERPFEHWYRGDISRNGGVGELRVARKQEMLDIANYGHTLRQASSKISLGVPSSRSRSNSRGEYTDVRIHTALRTRPRAGSLGGARESIYLDDDHARAAAMVSDEQPLTDLDSDGEDPDDTYDEDITDMYDYSSPPDNSDVPPPVPPTQRSDTPTSSRDLSNFKSRIPTPTPRIVTDPPRTPTPTQPSRNSSEPPPSTMPSTPRTRGMSQSRSQPNNTSSQANGTVSASAAAKKRGKSPASSPPSGTTAKKTKTTSRSPARSPAKSPPKKTTPKRDEVRRSVSQYPDPDGDNVVDAIPTWTQPVPPSGNWDDVVLPVVARKKGLENHYATADGTPKPKPQEEPVYEPAPGTFGFDYTKQRPPRTNLNPADMPMDEFGQRKESESKDESRSARQPVQPSPSPRPSQPPFTSEERPSSPAPFSHYAISETRPDAPRIETGPNTAKLQDQYKREQMGIEEEESSGGCCKCIIM